MGGDPINRNDPRGLSCEDVNGVWEDDGDGYGCPDAGQSVYSDPGSYYYANGDGWSWGDPFQGFWESLGTPMNNGPSYSYACAMGFVPGCNIPGAGQTFTMPTQQQFAQANAQCQAAVASAEALSLSNLQTSLATIKTVNDILEFAIDSGSAAIAGYEVAGVFIAAGAAATFSEALVAGAAAAAVTYAVLTIAGIPEDVIVD